MTNDNACPFCDYVTIAQNPCSAINRHIKAKALLKPHRRGQHPAPDSPRYKNEMKVRRCHTVATTDEERKERRYLVKCDSKKRCSDRAKRQLEDRIRDALFELRYSLTRGGAQAVGHVVPHLRFAPKTRLMPSFSSLQLS